MKEEYIRLIAELDRQISQLRGFWLSSSTPEEKTKWLNLLDESLDERLRLMRCRDA
jgi:hypothetical protein